MVVQASNATKTSTATYTLSPAVGVFFYKESFRDEGIVVRAKTHNTPGLVLSYKWASDIWSPASHNTGASSMNMGYTNTATIINYAKDNSLSLPATFPAVSRAANKAYNMYLPAVNELQAVLPSLDPSIAAELGILPGDVFWTSTEVDADNAYTCSHDGSVTTQQAKNSVSSVVALLKF